MNRFVVGGIPYPDALHNATSTSWPVTSRCGTTIRNGPFPRASCRCSSPPRKARPLVQPPELERHRRHGLPGAGAPWPNWSARSFVGRLRSSWCFAPTSSGSARDEAARLSSKADDVNLLLVANQRCCHRLPECRPGGRGAGAGLLHGGKRPQPAQGGLRPAGAARGVFAAIGLSVGWPARRTMSSRGSPCRGAAHERYATEHLEAGIEAYDKQMEATDIYRGRRAQVPASRRLRAGHGALRLGRACGPRMAMSSQVRKGFGAFPPGQGLWGGVSRQGAGADGNAVRARPRVSVQRARQPEQGSGKIRVWPFPLTTPGIPPAFWPSQVFGNRCCGSFLSTVFSLWYTIRPLSPETLRAPGARSDAP